MITLCLQTAQATWFPRAPMRSMENPMFGMPALKFCALIALKGFHCFLIHGAFHNASSGILETFTCLTGSGIIWYLETRTTVLLPQLGQKGLTREMQQTAYLAVWVNSKSSPWHSGLTSLSRLAETVCQMTNVAKHRAVCSGLCVSWMWLHVCGKQVPSAFLANYGRTRDVECYLYHEVAGSNIIPNGL